MGLRVKCENCRHCEIKDFDVFECSAQEYITMTAYGVFEFWRTCPLYKAKGGKENGKVETQRGNA